MLWVDLIHEKVFYWSRSTSILVKSDIFGKKASELKICPNDVQLNSPNTVCNRAGRPFFFWNRFIEPVPLLNQFIGTGSIFEPVYRNRFHFWTGLSEPVPFLNRFIQTGFYLGNRFKVYKKNINKRSKIKVKFKVFLEKLVPKLFL